MKLEADLGGITVEVEPSHQYSIKFCCSAADGSSGEVWQNGVWHGSEDEAKVCPWILPCEKNGTHWHSLTLAVHFWRPNSGREHSVASVLQQWWKQVAPTSSDFYKQSMWALTHHWWKFTASGGDCWKIMLHSWEFALSSSIIVLYCICCSFHGNK